METSRNWTMENINDSTITLGTTTGKNGGGAVQLLDGTSDYIYKQTDRNMANSETVCCAFWFKSAAATTPSATTYILSLTDRTSIDGNSSGHGRMRINTSGQVELLGGGGSGAPLISVLTNVCDTNWHFIQMAYKNASTGGVLRLNVDGTASVSDITSGNTLGSSGNGSDPCRNVVLQSGTGQDTTYYIDDLIVYDNVSSGISGDLSYSSSYPLSEYRIETLTPSAAGTNSGWTPDSGANYTNVDEAVSDDSTTKVSTSSGTTVDTYNFTDIAGTAASVVGVMISSRARTAVGGTTDIKHRCYSNTTTNSSATLSLNNAWEFRQTFLGQDPDTSSAWTESGLDAAEFGVETT